MQKFKSSDIVRLISGSPDMTVEGYEPNKYGALLNYVDRKKKRILIEPKFTENVMCVWFEGTVQKRGMFHQDLLEEV